MFRIRIPSIDFRYSLVYVTLIYSYLKGLGRSIEFFLLMFGYTASVEDGRKVVCNRIR